MLVGFFEVFGDSSVKIYSMLNHISIDETFQHPLDLQFQIS